MEKKRNILQWKRGYLVFSVKMMDITTQNVKIQVSLSF